MTVEKIGLNFSELTTNPPPIPEFVNMSAIELINYIPDNANTMTNGYYGLIVLLVLGIFLFWLFSDRGQFGQFRYSVIRALGLSMGICLMFGIQMIQIGYITNLIHLGYFLGFYMMMNIYVIINNPQ